MSELINFHFPWNHQKTYDQFQGKQKWTNLFQLVETIKCQCCPHIETSQLIHTANQLTRFCMRATLAFNALIVEKKYGYELLLIIK